MRKHTPGQNVDEIGPNPQDSQNPYWQNSAQTLKSKIAYAYANNELTDVEFLVGGAETRILANKTILSLQSPVFAAMFSNRWASSGGEGITSENIPSTSTDPHLVQVKLPDIEPAPFRSFLKFLYTEELETTIVCATQVLYISRKYQVDELSKACLNFVSDNIVSSNALPMLEEANNNFDPVLEQITLKYICRNSIEVFSSESFLLLRQEELVKLLEKNDLIINEVLLFKYVWRWAQNECVRNLMEPNSENCRQALGSAFTSIRFLQMNAEDFVAHVAKLKIFSAEEENEILRYISLPETLKPPPETEFMQSLMPSSCSRKQRHVVTRVGVSEPIMRWNGSKTPEKSCNHCFTINRPAALVSCGFFGPVAIGNVNFTVCLSLKNEDCDYTYASINTTVLVEPLTGKEIFHVPFTNPVPLTPGVWYTLNFAIHGPPTLAGNQKPIYAVTTVGNDPALIKFKDARISNAVNQLPELCFEF